MKHLLYRSLKITGTVQVNINKEGKHFISLQKKISEADFNKVHRIQALREALETTLVEFRSNPKNTGKYRRSMLKKSCRQFSKLQLLKNELTRMVGMYNDFLDSAICHDSYTL